MSNVSSSSSSAGIGFFGLLTITLLVLKLTGLVAISWFWVFSPLIAGFILWAVIIAIVLGLAFS